MLRMVKLAWSPDRISQWWIDPPFLVKYPSFSWVHPWPGNGLHAHWILLGLFALFLTVGFLSRISVTLFILSHTYFFLLDPNVDLAAEPRSWGRPVGFCTCMIRFRRRDKISQRTHLV